MIDLIVRGTATADEVAALLAALARRPSTVDDDPYERWRRGRIAALARGRVVGPPPR